MEERDWFNNQEGWLAQDNYYGTYASCQRDAVMTEVFTYPPKSNS